MKFLILLAVSTSAFGQVGISLQQADQAAIPGSARSVYADVEGTPNLNVQWKVSGGCTLASPTTNASRQVVTAPTTGSSCKLTTQLPTNTTPNFNSATSCTVTATSAADPSRTATIMIPVCAPPVTLSTFPMTTVLYKNQWAVIQSNLRGSVQTGVTWAITSNPGGAASIWGGSSNRHAIFVAKKQGTYVLTATSAADRTKTASSTIYVTDHDLPRENGDHTEAVDCTAVGSGKTYEVGPARAFRDLNAVPWPLLKRGDTVRVHNDDDTGRSPTTYHQHIVISASGAPGQPLRICGVPDAMGVKPIIDGADATTRADEDWAGNGVLEELGLITLFDSAHKWDTRPDGNQNVIVEGLHLRNAMPSLNFVKQANAKPTPYNSQAGCIMVYTGRNIMLRGNELENCSNGIFAKSGTPQGMIVYNLTIQGNYLHSWGLARDPYVHGMYLQAIGLQLQFNYFGASTVAARGNVIKTRSVLNFLRWNYISQPVTSTARAFDFVEPQEFVCYVTPFAFAVSYHGKGFGAICNPPHAGPEGDPTTADDVAANFEAYHSDYVYGNILDDSGSDVPFVHYGYDQQTADGPYHDRRGGTLYYWNNTHLSRKKAGQKSVFDPSGPDTGHSYEFPAIQSINNVFSSTHGTLSFNWVKALWAPITVTSNWISPNYTLPNRRSEDTYQGGTPLSASCNFFGFCKESSVHMVFARGEKPGTAAETLYTGNLPFSPDHFFPRNELRGLGAILPLPIHDQPSNMQYFPAVNEIKPRPNQSTLGALD